MAGHIPAMFKFWRRSTPAAPAAPEKTRGMFTTHTGARGALKRLEALSERIKSTLPSASFDGVAMDSQGSVPFKGLQVNNMPDELVGWFASQNFIGHHLCAIVAQQWLVDKACTMPARDAIRHGFTPLVTFEDGVTHDENDDRDIAEDLKEEDKNFRLAANMEQFVRMGRIFGIRVAFFLVETEDPVTYYENPFNPDGVTPGSYKGIVQVDPYWCVPLMDANSAANPASPHFYEPTWWVVNGRKIHRTHLCIFRNSDVPDLLKPMYQYGGIPVPQKIMERVYAAERTANEAPQLAMAKRTTVWATETAEMLANQDKFVQHMQNWTEWQNNFGVKVVDTDDEVNQFDTTLADLDETIMTQYQLVAAAANVPATKLLGTTPKGFNSTGEYEEASYHEELETIQENDLTPFVERHHMLVLRSIIEPSRNLAPGSLTVTIDWEPVDSPTAKEYAEINKINAETDQILVNAGAIDGMDVRGRLQADNNSNYADLADVGEGDSPEEIANAIMNGQAPDLGDDDEAPGVPAGGQEIGAPVGTPQAPAAIPNT